MNNIEVFESERECGLEEQIQTRASVAFVAELSPHCKLADKPIILPEVILASLSDPDIYPVYSILVTTSWNKNDDIFSPEEVWASRKTPLFKPTNLEHDEKQIVGGIVNCWPIDTSLAIIDDTISSFTLPDVYHLLVSSVIYRQWKDPELRMRAEKLIAEIEAGNKYVSMECLFRGFDYGVIAPDGNTHVLTRTAETAFLTQHLRAYGGTGSYQDHKLGRLIRNITFSGKGFVDRPANPDSIIFDKNHVFSFTDAKLDEKVFLNNNGVSKEIEGEPDSSLVLTANLSSGDYNMSDEMIKELKDSLAALKAENKELSDKLAEANTSAIAAELKDLKETVANREVQVQELETKLSEATDRIKSLEADLEAKVTALNTLQAEMDKKEKEKKDEERKKKMKESGMPEKDVEARYESFASLSDEQFDAFISVIASVKPAEVVATETEEETVTAAEEVVEEDTTEADNLNVSSEENNDEISEARAALAKWVEECIMK